MSSAPKTTRDQLTQLVDLMRRTIRHLWLVGLLSVIGAGLSIMFAMKQTPQYDSETVLLYQEKISQSVLQGREVARNSRTMSARFKEMLLSRTSLGIIVKEFNLYPDTVEEDGTVAAAEKLRMLVNFSSRGAGTYRISYRGNTAEEAQKITARLASLLLERDELVRRTQAEQTQKFLENEKVQAENALLEAQSGFASFQSKHPEFITDGDGAGGGVGSAIRAKEASNAENSRRSSSGGSRIGALKRAAKRLRDRIANPSAPIAPVARKVRRADSPALQEARRELADAKRDLADKNARFKPKHPDVKAAQNGVNELTRRLRKVEGEEAKRKPPTPLTSPTITASTSVVDLKEELARIDSEISRLMSKSKSKDTEEPEVDEASTTIVDTLVELETQYAQLQRRMDVAGQRLSSLEARAFTAEITASAEFAEAAQLVIIEKAYLPSRAAGKGKKIVVIAGTVVFGLLGGVLALGLALIDDRIYRRADIDELGIAPVLVVIPKATNKKRWKRGQKTKSSKS